MCVCVCVCVNVGNNSWSKLPFFLSSSLVLLKGWVKTCGEQGQFLHGSQQIKLCRDNTEYIGAIILSHHRLIEKYFLAFLSFYHKPIVATGIWLESLEDWQAWQSLHAGLNTRLLQSGWGSRISMFPFGTKWLLISLLY